MSLERAMGTGPVQRVTVQIVKVDLGDGLERGGNRYFTRSADGEQTTVGASEVF